MKKILRCVLNVSVILSLSSCTSWDWEPDPYVGDSVNQLLVRESGETIQCNQPAFDRVVCLDEKDFSDLITEIDNIKNNKLRRKLRNKYKQVRR